MVQVTTAASPNEGTTSSSLSVEQSGSAVRHAAAQARSIYLELAAQRLGVAPDSLSVEDGTIAGPGNLRTSYWELADDDAARARCHPRRSSPRHLRPGVSPARRRLGSISRTRCSAGRASSTTWSCPVCCTAGS